MKKFALMALLLTASMASAVILADFEDGVTPSAGTLQADPENASNTVLFLDLGQVFTVATPLSEGIVYMDIYDFGDTIVTPGTSYGPRWGVAGAGEIDPDSGSTVNKSAGAQIIYKTYLNGDNGYGYGWETIGTGSWYSPGFFGGPRQVDALQVQDDPETTEVDESAPGDGAWTTWVFKVASDGSVMMQAFGQTQTTWYNGSDIKVAGMNEVRVSGGRTSVNLPSGVLVDNITYIFPEPATMGMLALGGLALIRRRK